MPTYDYLCEACGHALELFQNISAAPKRKCPKCKRSKLKRQIGGGAGFLFKGSGFYLTDYRSDSYRKAAEADAKPPPAADSAPKTPGKAAEKAADKTSEKTSEKTEAKPAPPSAPSKERAKKRSK